MNGRECHRSPSSRKTSTGRFGSIRDPAHAVQAGDHLQDGAVAAAIHRRVQRLELLAAHCGFGIYAGSPAVRRKSHSRRSLPAQVPAEPPGVPAPCPAGRPGSIFVAGGLIAIGLVLAANPASPSGWIRRLPRRLRWRRRPFRRRHGNAAGGGFHGFSGGSRFGNGGFYDHSGDAGFGRGGWGSSTTPQPLATAPPPTIRAIPNISTTPRSFSRTGRPLGTRSSRTASTRQIRCSKIGPTKSTASSRTASTPPTICRPITIVLQQLGRMGRLLLGGGFRRGPRTRRHHRCPPGGPAAISVAGNPYYYAGGVYYAPAASDEYQVVPPPQGAVVSTPPPSCSSVYSGSTPYLDCGGAYYDGFKRLSGDFAADRHDGHHAAQRGRR